MLIKDLEALHQLGWDTLPDSAWYTKSGQKAAEQGADDAYEQSKE